MPPFGSRNKREGRPQRSNRPMRRRKQPSSLTFDYKDVETMKQFLNQRGKIIPRRKNGLNAKQQRGLALAVKRARHLALLPYEIQ